MSIIGPKFEATFVVIKPDGITKSLTGNILTRLSEAKLEISAAKVLRVSRELAEEHYKDLTGKPFFEELIKYITGGFHPERKKVLAMVYAGKDAIAKVRELSGATNPEEADRVSIRGQFGRITTKGIYENVIHSSSDRAEAEREIKLWFDPDDVIFDLYPTITTGVTEDRRIWAPVTAEKKSSSSSAKSR
jgi:nucleoside-diphosphate kinase